MPFQTIYGNMHGAMYPIIQACLANMLNITSAEQIGYYVQCFMVMLLLMSYPFSIWKLTHKLSGGFCCADSDILFRQPILSKGCELFLLRSASYYFVCIAVIMQFVY